MTDKQKNIALVIGFVFLLMISYVFSIQKTFDLKSRVKALKKENNCSFNKTDIGKII